MFPVNSLRKLEGRWGIHRKHTGRETKGLFSGREAFLRGFFQEERVNDQRPRASA